MNILKRFNPQFGRQANQAHAQEMRLPLDEHIAIAQFRQRQLRKVGRVWDPTVRRLMAKLAQAKWPGQNPVGILPVSTTRLRRSVEPGKITWWVEHDLPPYDLYLCAAYFVTFELSDDLSLLMTVYGGKTIARLEKPAPAALERALVDALYASPATIPRRMGAVLD